MRYPNKFKFLCGSLVLLLALVMGSGSAQAGTIYYGDRYGTTIDFLAIDETTNTPGDPETLYGAPTIVRNQLLFNPTNYSSASGNGSADTTSGTLRILLEAHEGFFIEKVRIREYGDFATTGPGTSATQVHPSGGLFVTPLDGDDPFNVKDAHASQVFTGAPSSANWSLYWEIDFTGLYVTQAMLSFNNNLQTTSEADTTSFVQKKLLNGPAIVVAINEHPVPLPAAALLLGTGLIGVRLFRKRRK